MFGKYKGDAKGIMKQSKASKLLEEANSLTDIAMKDPSAENHILAAAASIKAAKSYEGVNDQMAKMFRDRSEKHRERASKATRIINAETSKEGENCPHCGASMERGDNGKCNRCGKDWPHNASTTT